MGQGTKYSEKREFFRLEFESPLRFKTYQSQGAGEGGEDARTRNISESGVLFQTKNLPPQISSLLWMGLDLRTLKICREIESRALILDDGVLGKVVHVEENRVDARFYDVGVCFLTKEEQGSVDARLLVKDLKL